LEGFFLWLNLPTAGRLLSASVPKFVIPINSAIRWDISGVGSSSSIVLNLTVKLGNAMLVDRRNVEIQPRFILHFPE